MENGHILCYSHIFIELNCTVTLFEYYKIDVRRRTWMAYSLFIHTISNRIVLTQFYAMVIRYIVETCNTIDRVNWKRHFGIGMHSIALTNRIDGQHPVYIWRLICMASLFEKKKK